MRKIFTPCDTANVYIEATFKIDCFATESYIKILKLYTSIFKSLLLETYNCTNIRMPNCLLTKYSVRFEGVRRCYPTRIIPVSVRFSVIAFATGKCSVILDEWVRLENCCLAGVSETHVLQQW